MPGELIPSASCTLCLSPIYALDNMLMLYGPEATAVDRKMPVSAGSIGGILHDHWQHLHRAMLLPLVRAVPPPDDSDELIKVRWGIRQVFNLCYSADDTPNIDRTDTDQVFKAVQTKNAVLANLREFIKLEAEIKGTLESGKLRARRKEEVRQATEEELLPEATRMQVAKADLRRAGYRVEKIADDETELDVTEDDDATADD